MSTDKVMPEVNDGDLFNNPMVKAALASMTPEQIENYKKIGEKMYGNLNFEDPRYIINPEIKMTEALACIESQIRSGLHPSDIEDKEKALLVDAYGENWYEKWGFVKQDLKEIVTVKTKN
tara:strand:+ start:65 stop:424 length:360 start_codon:yes stop_codon:yes gene_type:complete